LNSYIPFVYIIKNKTTQLKYLGVKYAKGCNPTDMWTSYFTSSKLVKKLINQFGYDDWIIKIIHQFPNDPEAAILKEASYFKYLRIRDDYLNITYSSGCQDLRIASKGGKVGGAIVFARKIGIFRCNEERKKWASAAGKIGGTKQRDEKLGFHGLSKEQKLINSSAAGKINSIKNDWGNKQKQANRGKIGGPKNKGFVWLTDGNINIKYSPKLQKQIPTEQYLINNPTFRRGRTRPFKAKETNEN
jgi:hypothetical protein